MRLAVVPYMLKFAQPAGTSRGVLTEKPTYFIKVFDERIPEIYGLGECAVFPGLSPEADHRYEYKLVELLANIAIGRPTDLSHHSSIQFGLEQALRDYASGGKGIYYTSPFIHGESEITINGLVWMGNYDEMLQRLEQKIDKGFHCIKIKIGAIEWSQERELIKLIRERYSPDQVTIRVDANGGFCMDNIFPVLKQLADLNVHSIEQPIPARNAELMSFVCKMSPVPVALDEELIGIYDYETKRALLEGINPAYIILKPALCGGFSGAEEWIKIANEFGIGWWITSALESNIGLNAIAQWTAHLGVTGAQGLGTGGLYTNNIATPLFLDGEHLRYNPEQSIDRTAIDALDWKY
ncbi:MAG: o-succinylbenzoate synthase [Muribaculaceae bacterium]|nr:o-succinylbenzoate synthase [Muribaculaceae bacterium]